MKRGFGRGEGKFLGGFVRGKGKKLYLCTELGRFAENELILQQ